MTSVQDSSLLDTEIWFQTHLQISEISVCMCVVLRFISWSKKQQQAVPKTRQMTSGWGVCVCELMRVSKWDDMIKHKIFKGGITNWGWTELW